MAEKIAHVYIDTEARTAKAKKELKGLEGDVNKESKKMGSKFNTNLKRGLDKAGAAFDRFGARVKRSLKYLAVGAFAGLTAGIVKAVQTSARFEKMQLRLEQVIGSVDEAKLAYKEFVDFTKKSPFQLDEVVNSAATLEAFGAQSRALIKPLGDLSAFMGIDMVDAAGAFGRAWAAGAGAADILRERGVLSLVKLKAGVNDLTKLTLPEFRKALVETMTDPSGRIFGGTDKLAKTLEGRWSTLKDNVTIIFKTIGDSINTRLGPELDKFILKLQTWMDSGKMQEFANNIAVLFNGAADAIQKAAGWIQKTTKFLADTKIENIRKDIDSSTASLERMQSRLDKLNSGEATWMDRLGPSKETVQKDVDAKIELIDKLKNKLNELNEQRFVYEPYGPPKSLMEQAVSNVPTIDYSKGLVGTGEKETKTKTGETPEETFEEFRRGKRQENSDAVMRSQDYGEEAMLESIAQATQGPLQEIPEQFADGFNSAYSEIGKGFAGLMQTMLSGGKVTTSQLVSAFKSILNFIPGGSAVSGILSALGFGDGGTLTRNGNTFSKAPKFADGGSFTVPSGYPNDTFPLPAAWLSSGEKATITPAGKSGMESKQLANIAKIMQANTETQILLNRTMEIKGTLDSKIKGNDIYQSTENIEVQRNRF